MMSDEASTEVDKTTTEAIETSEPVKTTTEVKTTEGFDAVCPEDIFLSFVPHPDCNKYYECAWGVPILMSCPPTLYFDPRFNICNYPDQVDCKMPSTTEAASSTTEEVVDTTTTEAVPSTTEEVVNTTTTEAAPSTTEEVVDTTTSEASETTTAVPVNTTSVQPNISDDTHRFRRSVNKMMSDEASTEVDKTTTDAIETSEPVKTTTEVKTTEGFDAVCPEDIFLSFVPHPDCNKYYECAWGVPILMSCPPTLYFDPRFNICNYPDQV